MESWQSGNAPDSKSGEPANTGAQVQILYSPYCHKLVNFIKQGTRQINIWRAFVCEKKLKNVKRSSHFAQILRKIRLDLGANVAIL